MKRAILCAAAIAATVLATAISASGARLAGPSITSFSPASGPYTTTVTINGSGFTGTTNVRIGNDGPQWITYSNTKITFRVPRGAQTSKITVTAPGGTATSATNFTVTDQPVALGSPLVAKIGDLLSFRGLNIIYATSVKLNGQDLGPISVDGIGQYDETISVHLPAVSSVGKFTITTPFGTTPPFGQFHLQPTITGFSPTFGAPGTHVDITGTGLTTVQKVTFGGNHLDGSGGVKATFTHAGDTVLHVTSPVVPDKSALAPISAFTSLSPTTWAQTGNFRTILKPKISSFTPTEGPVGTVVTITGQNLNDVTQAWVGTHPVLVIEHVDNTHLKVTIPPGVSDGRYKMSVGDEAGVAKGAVSFRVKSSTILAALGA